MLLFRLTTLFALVVNIFGQLNETFDDSVINGHAHNHKLSRRKRFLIFPEGSSVQLVFCVTYPTIFAIGDIFLWGYTAALAYELPQDPYSPFNHKADPLHRRADTKTVYYTNDDGVVLFKRPYKKKTIVNPAFAKRSVVETSFVDANLFKKGSQEKFNIDRKQMHGSKHKREFLKREQMGERSIEFHRSSRVALYRKIETLLDGLGNNGRNCLLKTLCIVGQNKNAPEASFLQEIVKAVFTLPKESSESIDDPEYDQAHSTTESCEYMYPGCSDYNESTI